MSPPLEDHISPLFEPLVNELIAGLGCLSGFAASSQENAALLVLNGHEVGGDLDVYDVAAVRVGAEVVHEQVVGVVDEEVEGVDHLTVVADQGHLYGLLHDLGDGLLGPLLLLQQLNLHLLFGLFKEELGLADHLLALLQGLLDLTRLLQHAHVVPVRELILLLLEKLGADISFLVEFLRLELHVDEVGILQKAGKFVQFLLLQEFKLLVK